MTVREPRGDACWAGDISLLLYWSRCWGAPDASVARGYFSFPAHSKSTPLLCKDHPSFRSATAYYSRSAKAFKAGHLEEAEHWADTGWQTVNQTIRHLGLRYRTDRLDDSEGAYEHAMLEQRRRQPGDWVREKVDILQETLANYGSMSCAGPPTPPTKLPPLISRPH